MDPTRRLLGAATDRAGRDALTWVGEAVPHGGVVLELTPHGGTVGGGGMGRHRFVAHPAALPIAGNGVDAALLLLVLAGVDALDAAFAELRRVLRPSGTLVVLVPSAARRSLAEARSPLRTAHRSGWPNRSALDRVGWLLAAADFAVLGDDRRAFTVAGAGADDLRSAGLWPPGGPTVVVPPRLPAPLRRVVARR